MPSHTSHVIIGSTTIPYIREKKLTVLKIGCFNFSRLKIEINKYKRVNKGMLTTRIKM